LKLFSTPKEEILFPDSLKTDEEGFHFFSYLIKETQKKKLFILNFEHVEWVEANLCAVLGAIVATNTKTYGAKFEFVNMKNSYLETTLRNNGFLKEITGEERDTRKSSAVPYQEFSMKNEEVVEEYIFKYVLLKEEVPKMSKGAKKKIYRSIFELYQNSVLHSGADQVFVCGQFFRYKGRMALTMVEIGKTFEENVKSCYPEFEHFSGADCLNWAVKSGNTTKPETETGGLGLDLIRDFLKMNQGKLQIRSGNGYWIEKNGMTNFEECERSFCGSIVNIEFNLRDKNEYFLSEELDANSLL